MRNNKSIIILLLLFSTASVANCQEETLRQKAYDALMLLQTVKPIPVVRNTNPDAQWFPEAGFGLFMHFGIHSVAALEPSWAMIKNLPWAPDDTAYFDRKYYSLLWQFHLDNYDPDKWMKAAKEAGMNYAVITAKHHDGYALWPGEYTNLGTKKYMEGRDLLKPYVEACRKYGLKVGFYFSPRDWSYPGFPVSMDFKNYGNGKPINPRTPEQNQHDYDKFFEYTAGQLSELLTRYGKIDLLWFLHIIPGKQEEIWLKINFKPLNARLLQTNEKIKYKKKGNTLLFDLPEKSNGLDDVIVVTWKEVPTV